MSFSDEDNDDPEELQKDLDEYFEKRRISVEDRLEEQRLEEERLQAQKRATREKRKRFFYLPRKLFFALIILLAITFCSRIRFYKDWNIIEFYILQKYPYYKILLADRKQIDSLKHSKKRNTRVQSKIPKQKNN